MSYAFDNWCKLLSTRLPMGKWWILWRKACWHAERRLLSKSRITVEESICCKAFSHDICLSIQLHWKVYIPLSAVVPDWLKAGAGAITKRITGATLSQLVNMLVSSVPLEDALVAPHSPLFIFWTLQWSYWINFVNLSTLLDVFHSVLWDSCL